MVDFVTGLRCRECQRAFPAEALHVCDYCFGPLEVAYDYERIAASISRERIEAGPRSIWRYRDLLPVDDATPVDLGAGFTPLVRADRLAAELGLGELWIKDDTANPTGLLQGPGGLGGPHQGPPARASRWPPAPRRATWPTRWRPTPPGPGWTRSS